MAASISYAQVLKANASTIQEHNLQHVESEVVVEKKKRRRRGGGKKQGLSDTSSVTHESYESDLYKEHPYFPLSPIKGIQDKQKQLINQKAGIVPIKILKRPETIITNITPSDPVQVSFSPPTSSMQSQSQSHQFVLKSPIITSSDTVKIAPPSDIQRIFTCMPYEPKTTEIITDEQVNSEKNAKMLSGAYDSTIKHQQKEIMANSEVIENQKQTMKEQSKGINTNNTKIASQIKTIEEHNSEISTKKDEIIKLSHQLNTIQSSYEHYNAELSKVYGNWMHYYNLLNEIQRQYTEQYQKNQLLIQHSIALEQQIQQQQQQQQQQLIQVQPQYIQVPQEVYAQQMQQQMPQMPQQYMTLPMPTPEFMNAFMQAMASVNNQ